MEDRILARIIARGSDALAEAMYRQLLRDRMAAAFPSRRAPGDSWRRVIGRAVGEGLLEAAEARRFLRDMSDARAARSGRQGGHLDPTSPARRRRKDAAWRGSVGEATVQDVVRERPAWG